MSEPEILLPLSASQMEAMEEAVSSYQAQLTADAARYLLDRGIGRAQADTFRLGVAVEPLPEHARFAGMLSIPYLDREGKPLSIRFRCLEQHEHRDFYHGKYNSVKGEQSRLYGVDAVHRAGDVIHLAEGELDRIVLEKIGLPAVAVPGVDSWKGRHRRMLAGFNRVYIWADPDEAGGDMARRVSKSLPRSARIVRLRQGDVSETYQAGGAEALLAALERSV